jgi:3-phenylpropionate/trans-cinnamate dioxygenase ferredoxin reductase component
VPQVDWLGGAGIEVANGIVCDEFCATSRPRVYAAGDAAEWWNPTFAERMRVEHWTTAREQGGVAGRNLVADLVGDARARTPFRHVPYVWSDQYDLKIQIVGRVSDGQDREVRLQTGNQLSVAYSEGDELRGALCINCPRDAVRYRRLLDAG